jgi:hypothetical protein
MTTLSGGLNTTGSICRKHEQIEKVTAAQDDDFVGGLNTTGSICRKHEQIEQVTGPQDDDFVGGLEYNWLNMQKTRTDRKSHRPSG